MHIKPNSELAMKWAHFGGSLGGKIMELRQMNYILSGGVEITPEGLEKLKNRLDRLNRELVMLCKTTPEKLNDLVEQTKEHL